jgi:hypothetical protein
VGKTVFVQSLAARVAKNEFEVVVFDCFGGGSYRSDNHSRHLPRIGLVQIVNELASRTLCDPILPGGDDSRKIIKAACRRLAQAATAIRTQSKKLGLLIIVDAADNAQLEADDRHEEAFPKLLLSAINEGAIDGVKLLLTARTHRKDKVIDRATVKEVELGPFTDPEAREFLKVRKPGASAVEIATALARSGRNARVLDYLVQTWDTNVLGKTSAPPYHGPRNHRPTLHQDRLGSLCCRMAGFRGDRVLCRTVTPSATNSAGGIGKRARVVCGSGEYRRIGFGSNARDHLAWCDL